MKKVIICHCWGGKSEYCWYPKTKNELELLGFEVIVPSFPSTDFPSLHEWQSTLQNIAPNPDENLFLIGHSLGAPLILRYLEGLKTRQRVGGIVFVAGFASDLGPDFEAISNFFEKEFDFEKIKNHCNKFVDIASTNDPYVPLSSAEELRSKLNSKIITMDDMLHFSGEVSDPNSCISLPIVAQEIASMAT